MSYQVQILEINRERLALHSWLPSQPKALIFYVHGTQSHAGWLFDSGPSLAAKGVGLYALDRRGAGQSSGVRGHVSDFKDWIEDYVEASHLVRDLHRGCPMTALGQSFGGAILAGLAKSGRLNCSALALCAPALDQYRRHFKAPVPAPSVLDYKPVPLLDEWYTRDKNYLQYLNADELMLREITYGTMLQRLGLEEFYLDPSRDWPNKPTVLVLPRVDRIIDLATVRKTMDVFCGSKLMVMEFPSEDHYLEFSPQRESYLNFIAKYALTDGFSL